jgi:hypothetical protein
MLVQAVLDLQVVHHPVEDLAVLARIGALIDPADVLRGGRHLAQQSFTDVAGQVDVLDVNFLHPSGGDLAQQLVQQLRLVAEMRQQGTDEGVGADALRGELLHGNPRSVGKVSRRRLNSQLSRPYTMTAVQTGTRMGKSDCREKVKQSFLGQKSKRRTTQKGDAPG